jgi:hypothetical protein
MMQRERERGEEGRETQREATNNTTSPQEKVSALLSFKFA